ncbi:MAG: FAD-dependent oxidoreductase [Roseobacter sp.]
MNGQAHRKIVLVGGGHTHALVLNALKNGPLERASVKVINPGKTAPYSGMLPGFVAGHYKRCDLDIDLDALCAAVGATLVEGRANAIDLDSKQIHLDDGSSVPYDLASIDVGITSQMHALPGFANYGVPAKPLATFATQWDAFRSKLGVKSVAVIGGGIAGAELAMAMSHAMRSDPCDTSVKLLDRGKVLSSNSATAQKHMRRELKKSAVEILEHVDVAQITRTAIVLRTGEDIQASFVVGAAGATPHAWIAQTRLRQQSGFIEIDESLQTSAPDVFAVGDCAHMTFDPRPKAGVYAVRQAPVLLANIKNALSGDALQPYRPQSDYLKLVSLGGKRAFGEKRGLGMSGSLIWRLKDKIDRDFMGQF